MYVCLVPDIDRFLQLGLSSWIKTFPLQDVLSELQIPHHTVSASRRVPVVQYSLGKSLRRYTTDRPGMLAKCTAIDRDTAKKLLDHGYKQLSKFKSWCPVKVSATCITEFNFVSHHNILLSIVFLSICGVYLNFFNVDIIILKDVVIHIQARVNVTYPTASFTYSHT